jgi:hypothetical protein
MKTYSDQIFEDEILMELADGTLPENDMCRISRLVKNSPVDSKILLDFQASNILIQLLREWTS